MYYGIITMNIKLPVGMVTFGNLKYTKITYESLLESTSLDLDVVIVVGKPNDKDTIEWAVDNDVPMIIHDKNMGFPASVNDIYDYFWSGNSQLPLVIMGNDVVVYPGAVDSLVNRYYKTGADWVSASEVYTPERIVDEFPDTSKFFTAKLGLADGVDFRDIISYSSTTTVYGDTRLNYSKIIGDSHNLCLFSRKLYDTLGYIDVNFYPAYFEDNDYGRRAILSGELEMVRLNYSHYFHFWSRTIYEENMKVTNDKYFPMNKAYYIYKWGGEPGKETKEGNIGIFTREKEDAILNFWRNK